MPRFVVAETQPKRLAARGRSAPRETWRRWLIEGPLPRPLARWPENAPAAQQCFTNCRLLRQQCSRRLDGSDLQEGPLSACSLWFSRGRELGAGHGYRLNLRCTMHANRSPWGRRPYWARLVAFYFGSHGLTPAQYQQLRFGEYLYEPDHLPISGVAQHSRHRYCLAGHLEVGGFAPV
jgi:hypothetical protein